MKSGRGHSLPTRIVALGFIISIIAANFWVTYWYFGNQAPLFLTYLMQFAVGLVLFGAVGLAILSVYKKVTARNKDANERNLSDHPRG